MHPLKEEEIKQELMEEERKEPYYEWLDNNRNELETEYLSYIEKNSPEELRFDDDYSDFFNNHADEFEEWTEHIYFTTEVE